MALVDIDPMVVAFSYLDLKDTETDMRIFMRNPTAALIDAAGFVAFLQFAATDLSDACAALSDAALVRQGFTLNRRENNPPAFGGGEAEAKGRFGFVDSTGRPSFSMYVPGIKDACLQPNRRDIDLSNEDVAAFVAAMTTGTHRPITENGRQLVTVESGSAYKQHHESTGGSGRNVG